MGGHGSIGGVDGGSSLGGQEQGVVSGIGTPELEHLIVAIVGETLSELSHAPNLWEGGGYYAQIYAAV